MKTQTPTVVPSARQFRSGHFAQVVMIIVVLTCVPIRSLADWPNTNATKWVQYPDTNGIDVLMSQPLILADDFLCTNSGPVTDIHLWTSWLNDQATQVPFIISIWNDVPVSETNEFSHPGTNLLWQQTFLPTQYQYREWTNVFEEWFWNPEPPPFGQLMGFDHIIWQYNFYPTNPFVQEGTHDKPVVYWLSVTVPAAAQIGWKTSTNHWNDDAVFGHVDGQGNFVGSWMEMVDPRDTNISLDLSFALTTETPTMDFGDAPDQPYPTLLASNGARHTVVPAIRLGPLIDAEANGQPNLAATGDDMNSLPDEDGVVFNTPLVPGTMATVTVTASMGQLPLNAWVDFGLDGSWLTPGDQIFNNFLLAAGPNVLTFPVPPQPASVLGTTYARFRFSTMGNLLPTGAAPNGEVEDYQVQIEPPMDFGDAPDPTFPTLLANNGARHILVPGVQMGQNIDAELNGQPNATATGDDLAGINDADGVTFAGTLVPGRNYAITVNASVAGFLNAWVDFNGDGSWAQASDQIFNNQALAPGNNALNFAVPQTAAWGITTFARFRFDTVGGLAYTNVANDGEVEDYAMTMDPMPQHDLGDAPSSWNNIGPAPGTPMNAYPGVLAFFPTAQLLPVPLAPFGPIHMQPQAVAFLGANVTLEWNADVGADTDFVNNIVPAANTPNQDGADDGVALPLTLPHANMTQFNYNVVFPGPPPPLPPGQMFVNVWFDWNRDGDWNDTMTCPDGTFAPEWAVMNQPVAVPVPPQPYPLSVAMVTPLFKCWHPSVSNQPIWMRINIAEQMWPAGLINPLGGEGPMNGYLYGETEDYYLTNYNANQTFDFGDAPSPYPTLLAASGAQHLIVPSFWLGAVLDSEANGQPDPAALGDDNTGVPDDEDGVTWPAVLLVNTSACVTVSLTGPSGLLDAWVDFNGNGTWDASEQVFTNLALTGGANSALCFNVPLNAKFGTNFARFRLSTAGGLLPTGVANDGEVEDYLVTIAQPRPATNVVITSIAVTNVSGGQAVTLNWNAQTNIYYQVQSAPNLTNSPVAWTNISPLILGPSNSYTETNSPTPYRFYRVAVPFAWP